MPIQIAIGEHMFALKTAVQKRCREILYRYPIGTRVTSALDEEFLSALFQRHPDAIEKLGGAEIDHFAIGRAGPHKNFETPCFLFVTKEGTSVHFSFGKCLK